MEEADAMALEGAEEVEDVGMEVVNRIRKSPAPEHKHLRAVVIAVMEVLKDQGLPLNPTSYFAAVMNSLEQQCSRNAVDGPDTTAFCSFLALLLPKVSNPVLRSRSEKILEVLARILTSDKAPAGTIKAGLSCVEAALRAAEKSNWLALASFFNVLLKFSLDQRPKVRRRAHQSVAQVLVDLNGSNALDKASEAAAAYYENCMTPFIGGVQGQKQDAIQVLYMLGALKHVLPVMSPKGIGKLLPPMVLLFNLKQPLVTRHVFNVFFALSTRSRTDLPGAELASVMGAVSSLISPENSDVDQVMTAIHVLERGLANLFVIDPTRCAAKLPVAFSAITELFASEREEVVFGAAECLRSVIVRCIDDTLIKQGLCALEIHGKKSKGTTPIERICSSAERSLSYQYSSAWDKALHMVSALFLKLGDASFSLMAGVVNALADLQELEDADMPCRKQLHDTVGAAVAAMGPDHLLELLPLNMDDPDLSKARVWILPILKQHIVGARLRYFVQNILPLAGRLTARAEKCAAEERPVAAKNAEACAQSLWALLPSFCNYPVDTKDSFKLIAKPLGDAMKKNAELRGLISSSIQILIKQNKSAIDACENMDSGDEKEKYSKDVASANLSAIAAFSDKFLPLFFNLFCELPPEKRGDVQSVIGAIASISTKATVQKFFRTIIEKLLEATKEADAKERRCMFMDLALSLVGGLEQNGLNALFAVAKPALQDGDSGVQKKGYKVLANICKEHPDFLSHRAEEIFKLIQEGTSACQSSAKQYRILCLQSLILHLVKEGGENTEEYISCFLKEAILALKEVNKKTREAAFELIAGVGHGLLDFSEQNFLQFFRMVVGCSAVRKVAGEPHVISAALTAISRLVYEFPSELQSEVQRYLPSAYHLLRNYNSREVVKSLLGLMKVLVARLSKEEIDEQLPEMVPAMMVWSDDRQNRFKAKVRLILEKLIKRCGFDAVSAVMPKEHAKHLTNIRKRKEQAEKKKQRSAAGDGDDRRSQISGAGTSRSLTDVFSDTDDDNDGDDESEGLDTLARSKTTVRSKKLPKSRKRLPEEMTESGMNEPLDLLDTAKTRAALSSFKSRQSNADSDEEEEMEFDSDGRLIVEEKRQRKRQREDDEEEEEEDDEGNKKDKASKFSSRRSSSKAGGTGGASSSSKKKSKKSSSASGWSYKGEDYANKKGARGDSKKEGKLEPYAYWPLDAKLLNRRGEKKAAARRGMLSVVTVTKKLQGLSVNKALSGIQKRKKQNKVHKGPKSNKSKRR